MPLRATKKIELPELPEIDIVKSLGLSEIEDSLYKGVIMGFLYLLFIVSVILVFIPDIRDYL